MPVGELQRNAWHRRALPLDEEWSAFGLGNSVVLAILKPIRCLTNVNIGIVCLEASNYGGGGHTDCVDQWVILWPGIQTETRGNDRIAEQKSETYVI